MPRKTYNKKPRPQKRKPYKLVRKAVKNHNARKLKISNNIVGNKILHTFQRKVRLATIFASGTGGNVTVYEYKPKLSDLDTSTNYTSQLTGMYDYYRINQVRYQIIPRFTSTDMTYYQSSGVAQSQISIPIVYTCTDYDGNFPTDEDQFLQRGANPVRNGLKKRQITFKPKLLLDVNGTSGTTNMVMKSGWLDINNIDSEHYGCAVGITKLSFQDSLTAVDPTMKLYYDVIMTMNFSCKGLR